MGLARTCRAQFGRSSPEADSTVSIRYYERQNTEAISEPFEGLTDSSHTARHARARRDAPRTNIQHATVHSVSVPEIARASLYSLALVRQLRGSRSDARHLNGSLSRRGPLRYGRSSLKLVDSLPQSRSLAAAA